MPTVPKIKGPKVWGQFFDLRYNSIPFVLRNAEAYGYVAEYRVFKKKFWFVGQADIIHHVLLENSDAYKKSKGYKILELLTGKGLFTAEGERWKALRRLYGPSFSRKSLEGYFHTTVDVARRRFKKWAIHENTSINLTQQFNIMAMEVAGETLFSSDWIEGSDELFTAIAEGLAFINVRALQLPFSLPMWMPTPQHRKFKRHLATIDRVIFDIIEKRQQTTQSRNQPDLLDRILENQGVLENTRDIRRQIRDEVCTLFMAGHETTFLTLLWTIHNLALHPKILQQCYAEIDAAQLTEELHLGEIEKLELLQKVLLETLRLYPPVWHFGRVSTSTDTAGGLHIPKETHLRISPLLVHRNPAYWEQPLSFDPSRFNQERLSSIPSGAYIPFGLGARLCIGKGFAHMELLTLLTLLLKEYSISSIDTPHEIESSLTVRMKKELHLIINKRIK